jgi:hypothetical protein
MHNWLDGLPLNPLPSLLASADQALLFFVRRDLLDKDPGPVQALWERPFAARILRKQRANGAWRYPGQGPDRFPYVNYDLLETYRNLGFLVDMAGFNRSHPAIEKAAGYLLVCQTEEGDIRGILGNQTMPYYHGVILELLIKAGYADDPRVKKGLTWLLSVRQDDGGWVVPAQTVPPHTKTQELWTSSHLATGMALRAIAAHPDFKASEQARAAGDLLKSRFFQADKYNDRRGPGYWVKFQYPFWWTNLLTALDTLSMLGHAPDDAAIREGVAWFTRNQQADGLWSTGYGSGAKAGPTRLWVGLAVCRVLRRL